MVTNTYEQRKDIFYLNSQDLIDKGMSVVEDPNGSYFSDETVSLPFEIEERPFRGLERKLKGKI